MRLIDADEIAMHKFLVSNWEYQLGWNDAIDAIIENEPTIDAVPDRHGKWTGYAGTVGAECSICHAWLDVLQGTAEMNYCPNCGARMDEE